MNSALVSVLVLLVIFVAWPVSADRKDSPGAGGYGGDEDDDNDTKSWFPLDNQLSLSYYDKICPDFEKIVATKGCDASVLLDHEGSERRSPASKTLRGFELIDDIKSEIEKACPNLVSCADVLIAASRDATFQLGGPYWPNAYGRRDSTDSYARDVEKVPSGRRDITGLLETFQSYGLNVLDLVVLSGAHTIGKAYCGTIQSRLYNFNATDGSDPSIDPKYADFLRRKCRVASETVYLDAVTPVKFDNQYYINLQKKMGVLTTDQELVKDPRTAPLVKAFAEQPPHMFRQQFAVSMAKLVNVGVITGEDRAGVIRKVCSKSNSRPY
ncbi:hypothetical protein Bca52824_013809 [Brassica carinata]|uniref:Peroxidase n=1 Tax=Brassica carinata TaxID=52824 RepID=A0A8X7VZK4_BRACI|nr:hypothetical protein Bca52824_013809 [Brassica carinata]